MKIIHTKGPKVERDRERLIAMYRSLCRCFPWVNGVTNAELEKMNNLQLHGLCKAIWDEQSHTDQQAYLGRLAVEPDALLQPPKVIKFRPLIVPPELMPEASEPATSGYVNTGVPFVNA